MQPHNPYSSPEAVHDDAGACKTGNVKVTAPQVVRKATAVFFAPRNFPRLFGAALLGAAALALYAAMMAVYFGLGLMIFWFAMYLAGFDVYWVYRWDYWDFATFAVSVVFCLVVAWPALLFASWGPISFLRYYTTVFRGEGPGFWACFQANIARSLQVSMYLWVYFALLLGVIWAVVYGGYDSNYYYTAQSDFDVFVEIMVHLGLPILLAFLGGYFAPGVWLLALGRESYRRVMFFGGRVAWRNLLSGGLCMMWCVVVTLIGLLLSVYISELMELPISDTVAAVIILFIGTLFGGYVMMNYVAFCAMTTEEEGAFEMKNDE